MNENGHDGYMTSEYGVSVDDILEEFQQQEREAASQAVYQAYLDSLPGEEPLSPAPEPAPVDEEGVKLYRPKKAAKAEKAGGNVQQRVREERAQDSYAPAESANYVPDYTESYTPDYTENYAPADTGSYAPADSVYEPPAADDFEIDERFNLGGRREELYFGGEPVDLGAEEDYTPPAQEAWIPSHWGSGEGEYQPEDFPEKGGKKHKKRRGKKNKKNKRPINEPPAPAYEDEDEDGDEAYAAQFRDFNAEPADYASTGDYGFDRDEERDETKAKGGFPSFKEYLAGLLAGMLFRIRGGDAKQVADTAEEDDEDLGPELSCAAASKYYGSYVHSLRLRFRIGLGLLVIMAYISLGLPLPGMLKTTQVQAAMCLLLQLVIMLLCLDVLTGAAMNMARGRFGADSLAGLACVLTSIDALAVALDGFGSPHVPLCVLSSLSLMGVLLSSLLSARGLRKSLRVPAIGKRAYAVTGEAGLKDGDATLLKSTRSKAGFVRRSEEAGPDESLFNRASPLLLAAAFLLALVVCLAKRGWGEFLYIFTALLCPAAPVAALLCFALPFFIGSMRIFSSGAAIAGWSGLCDVGQSKNIIVTDRDLFPDGSAELSTIRFFADAPAEQIISYAGTMIIASGSSVSACFGELMETKGGSMRHVENFEYLPGGGMRGYIDGQAILCGSTDLMRLMKVKVPSDIVDKTTVLLAIDGTLYGIFNLTYTAQPQVRKALVELMRSNRHPIFAIRDFNVTPEMLRQSFDVATDGYDFPPYVERFAISEAKPAAGSKIAGVICREGLGPLTHMADTGRSMYVATRVNLLLTVLAAVIGVLAVFIKFLTAGSVGAGFLLAFMLLWALPVAVISVILKF